MFKKITLLGLSLVLFTACEIGHEASSTCPVVIGAPTAFVVGPNTTQVNVPVTLEVSYKTKKKCGEFVSFHTATNAGPLSNIITVNTTYDQCKCNEEDPETVEKENYTFKKSMPGLYVLKFKQTNETYVVHNVTVE
ncbi:hypothetical protein [Flavobacterium sp.]|uniref:hypothetical protein n=1 Tax=Flavobacterium sp. TaxID=239 RepID=UPI00260735FE|nr:hypothetical protein [Flavobacterium sp.]MDD3003504.1 hypothetical protein [Flavobacterium sp.]